MAEMLIAREDPLHIDRFAVGAAVRIALPPEHLLLFDQSGQRIRPAAAPAARMAS